MDIAADIEQKVVALCQAGEHARAVDVALRAYGPELLGFLRGRLRSTSDGDEAFAMFTEDLWRGLPGFGFRCSVRSWLYTLAINASNRYAVAPAQRRDRHTDFDDHPELAGAIAHVRTATRDFQRTDVKDGVRALRESLAEQDQLLLTLHVERALQFREIVHVLHGEALEEAALVRETARLRKRFERIKEELRKLAVEKGLLGS